MPTNNKVDEFVADKLKRTKTLPSEIASDEEFLRRIHLDLTGLPPTAEDVLKFAEDNRSSKIKRDELIDKLVGNDDYIDHWTNKWADLLLVNRKFLGTEGSADFRNWIRTEVASNTPYDEFARKIITASGSNKVNPPASYYKVLREPTEIMENTTQLFLATRFNCNKCHDHPFERWTQDQYYETTAYFAQVGLKKDDKSGDKRIGGTAVEGAKPLYEIIYDRNEGETKHDRTGEITPPAFPFAADHKTPKKASRRENFAAWLTASDNEYFAKSYVNRLWGYMTGTGIIEPIDDIRAGNPPTNPELLNWLTDQFIESGFDVRHLVKIITKSRTYQLSVKTNKWNEDDTINYSHAKARRLPAEVLFDTIYRVTGTKSKFPGVPEGTRAAQLPDSGVKLADGFLGNLGRPARESACECERSNELQLGPIMALISGPTVGNAISAKDNAITKLVSDMADDEKMIDELFLRVLNRHATPQEINAARKIIDEVKAEHKTAIDQLAKYEKEIEPRETARAKKRDDEIRLAKTKLEAYQMEIAPREAEADRKQKERIAKAELGRLGRLRRQDYSMDGGRAWRLEGHQRLQARETRRQRGLRQRRPEEDSLHRQRRHQAQRHHRCAAGIARRRQVAEEGPRPKRRRQLCADRAWPQGHLHRRWSGPQIHKGLLQGRQGGFQPEGLRREKGDRRQGRQLRLGLPSEVEHRPHRNLYPEGEVRGRGRLAPDVLAESKLQQQQTLDRQIPSTGDDRREGRDRASR
jgi:hypothetical protein